MAEELRKDDFQTKILEFLEEIPSGREEPITPINSPPADLGTSIGGAPESQEGEGGFSAFINDPRTVQAAVFGLAVLGSTAPDIGTALGEGAQALGQFHEVRQAREQAEFQNRVDEEKVNLQRQAVDIDKAQLLASEKSSLETQNIARKRLEFEGLRAIQENARAIAKADADKAISDTRMEGMTLQLIAKITDGYNDINNLVAPEDREPLEAYLRRTLGAIKKIAPRAGRLIAGGLAEAKKGASTTTAKPEKPGVFSRIGSAVGDFLFPTPEGAERLTGKVAAGREEEAQRKVTAATEAEQVQISRAERRKRFKASGDRRKAERGETAVAEGSLPPTAVAGGVPQAVAVEPTSTLEPGRELKLDEQPVDVPFVENETQLSALPTGARYFAFDKDGNLKEFIKGGGQVK